MSPEIRRRRGTLLRRARALALAAPVVVAVAVAVAVSGLTIEVRPAATSADGKPRAPHAPRISHDTSRHQLVFSGSKGGGQAVTEYAYRIGRNGTTYRANSDTDGRLRVSVPATLDDTVAHPVTVRARAGRWSAETTRSIKFLHRSPAKSEYRIQRFEAEKLLRRGKDAAGTRQSDCCKVRFSGGAQALLPAKARGDSKHLDFRVRTAATYRLVAKQTLAETYGVVSYKLDGKRLGPARDGFAERTTTRARTLGTVTLNPGTHRLTLTVEGKNAASRGYEAGLDYLELTPTLLYDPKKLKGAEAALKAGRAGERFTLPFEVGQDDWYALGTEQTVGPEYGAVTYALDGTALDRRFDARRARTSTAAVDLGIRHLTKGRHTLTFAAAPSDGKRRGGSRVGVDLLKALPLSGSYEAELITSRTTGKTAVQRNCCAHSWSGSHQRLAAPGKDGDELEFTFAVPLDGPHSLNVVMSRHPSFGTARFAVDGKPVGSAFDGHSTRPTTRSVHLGTRDFTEGLHTLTVTLERGSGGSGGSRGSGARTGAGVDRIDVYPEGEEPIDENPKGEKP